MAGCARRWRGLTADRRVIETITNRIIQEVIREGATAGAQTLTVAV